MNTTKKAEQTDQKKAYNKAIVEAMTDEELQEIKILINTEQVIRMKEATERIGT